MANTAGFIYAIGADGSPHVKIGKTARSVAKRLAMLQTGYPAPLKILAAVSVEQDLSRIEKAIHRFLEADRQQGEWFAVEVDQSQLEALIVRAVTFLKAEEARHEPLTLGERISLLRRRQGLSQQQLADQLVPPVSQTQIHRLEKGLIQDPHLSMVKALAHQLHVTIDWLAGAPAPAEETAQTRHRPRKATPVG